MMEALRILIGTMSCEVLHTTVTLRLNGEDYCGNRLTHYPDYESISYTMNSFLVMLNQEEDDQSGDLESADADVDNNVDVEMNTSVDDADRDNFELQYNSSLDQFRRQVTFEHERIMEYNILFPEILGYPTASISNTNTNSSDYEDSNLEASQELGLSPMDSHNRMTDSNRQCDMDRQTHNSYITQRSRYRKERFLFNTGSLQNTAEEVEESSMDTAIRIGTRRWLQERNLQIADTTAAETEVYHMMTNGTILDIGCGSNLRNFTEEIRDQMERESRMGKLYIQ